MAFETRRNGSYFYSKEWRNGRCVSSYVGAGRTAELINRLETSRRQEAALTRKADVMAIAALQHEDAQAAALFETLATLTNAYLLASGCYRHKGQWRRGREKKETAAER